MSVWNRSYTASYLSDNAEWHHMAVTWTKADNGRMRIFKDGLMMSEVRSPADRLAPAPCWETPEHSSDIIKFFKPMKMRGQLSSGSPFQQMRMRTLEAS